MTEPLHEVFERAYAMYVGNDPSVLHDRLQPILFQIVSESHSPSMDRQRLIANLRALSDLLSSSAGCTEKNLTVVDHFFSDWDDIWRPGIKNVPQDIREVFDRIITLHGGLSQPEFHTTPGQLAEMVSQLRP